MKRSEAIKRRSVTKDWNTAIRILYEREFDRLCHAAFRIIGDMSTAQDLVHDTFLLALLHRDNLSEHPSPGGWLTLTLSNLIQHERRRLLSHHTTSLNNIADFPAEAPASSLMELLPSTLSAAERDILIWRFEEQRKYAEIAAHLGISENACRTRVFRAVEKCRKLLDHY